MVAACAVCPLDEYPAALPRLAAQFPPGPVIYTGGLENHPRVVAELAASHELWGTAPDALERVRDPHQLFPALAAAGFAVPMLVPRDAPCPVTGLWLRKPIRSGGGLDIRFARPGESATPNHIFQEFIDGRPLSAVCGESAVLTGVTEPLAGEPWLHARDFAYCGNVGPVPTDRNLEGELLNLYRALVADVGLRGLFNVDFILRDGRVVPIEVNPRYSASTEVLEHALGRSVFVPLPPRRTGPQSVGKAIYYAPHDLSFPASGPWDADLAAPFDPWRLPAYADVPAPGTVVPSGHPVISIFAPGQSAAECRERLQSRARELDLLFAEPAT
ncbi:ATP-grasp domain-containing protein [Gemmata sp.]|uniref:ATP-grasp domain-containing protein n=1 Tax=Gemmata sp. TaxID=1914242 RepID=UPI003F6E5D51